MKTLSILIFGLIISSCSREKDVVKTPARINGIPEKAFWVGGVDGGNWYFVDYVHAHKNNAVIKVYNDIDGSLIMSKKFILICPNDNQMLLGNLQEQISAFDGEKIYLKASDGQTSCYLQ